MTIALASIFNARDRAAGKVPTRKYLRKREFVTHRESYNLRNPLDPTGNGPLITQFIDCHYLTLVAMVRLHDPFQDADNRRNPLVLGGHDATP